MTVAVFEEHRPRLTAIAYGIVGSVMEAEDVVQDAWLRWAGVDQDRVTEPAAYLTTIVTRLAIDRLRSAQRRRETYVGPWLPEPIVTEVGSDPADTVAEAERLSMALLTAMERLNPLERAVFLLREVFDYDYTEIAPIVGRSRQATRQIASRARTRVGDPERSRPGEIGRESEVVGRFLAALAGGDIDGLIDTLAADAVLWSDGGGARRAARHPVSGASKVATFLVNLTRRAAESGGEAQLVRANGRAALRLELDGELYGIMTFDFVDEIITAVRTVINPDKLSHLSDT